MINVCNTALGDGEALTGLPEMHKISLIGI